MNYAELLDYSDNQFCHIAELNKTNKKLEIRIAELEEIVKAVAHIGVDFGYGKYELEAGKIDDARTLMEQGE